MFYSKTQREDEREEKEEKAVSSDSQRAAWSRTHVTQHDWYKTVIYHHTLRTRTDMWHQKSLRPDAWPPPLLKSSKTKTIARISRDESWIGWLEGHADHAHGSTSGISDIVTVDILLLCPDEKLPFCVRDRAFFVQQSVCSCVSVVLFSWTNWDLFLAIWRREVALDVNIRPPDRR